MRSCVHCQSRLELRTVTRRDGSVAQERICRTCSRSSETPIADADAGPPDLVRFPYGNEQIAVHAWHLGAPWDTEPDPAAGECELCYYLSVRGNVIGTIRIDPRDTADDVEARARQFLELPNLPA